MKALFTSLLLICSATHVWAMGSAPGRPADRPQGMVEPKDADLSLVQAYHMALKQSETIAIRDEAVERVTGNTWESLGDTIGDADYVFTDFRQHTPEASGQTASDGSSSVGGSLQARTRSEGKFVLTQPLFRGLRSLSALQGAGSLRQQRIWEKKLARNDLFIDVAASYYGVIRAREATDTTERILSLFGERLEELAEREEIGRSRSSERVTSSARKRVIEAEYARIKGDLAIAENLFYHHTGADPEANRLADENTDAVAPSQAPDTVAVLESRPDVEAARQAMETARAAIGVERSILFPTADVTANLYNKREGFQKDTEWDVTFAFDVPLFDGGTGAGRLKQALSDFETAKLYYQLARKLAELDLKDRWEDWKASRDRYEALREAVAESEENFKLQKDEYARSLVSNLDVLSALEMLLQAQRDEINARYEMRINRWRYEISKGACCESV